MILPVLACLFASTRFSIVHVSVIDVATGQIARDRTVEVADGKIVEVSAKAPGKDAKTLDGKGKFLIPGLWDCHVHCWSDKVFFPLFLANGVTGIRDMFGPLPSLNLWRKQIADGAELGPHIVAAGRIVDGPKPIWPGSVAVGNAEEGRKAVETVQKEGSDFVKVYSLLPRDAYFAIADEAKKRKMVFAGHVPNAVAAREASAAGQKSFEHLYSVLAGCSSQEADLMAATTLTRMERAKKLIASYDPARADDLFATFKKNGTWQCPTLVVLNSVANLDSADFRKDPRLDYLPAYMTAGWDPAKDFRLKALTTEDYQAMRLRFAKEKSLMGAMAKAGVKILAGTDTPNPYCFPGFSLHDELRLMVEGGMSPLQALQAATLNPARYFGWEKTMGTVAKGKVADLVLLEANPLTDIRNTSKIATVIVGGKVLDRAQLDQMLNKKTALVPDSGAPRSWGFDGDD